MKSVQARRKGGAGARGKRQSVSCKLGGKVAYRWAASLTIRLAQAITEIAKQQRGDPMNKEKRGSEKTYPPLKKESRTTPGDSIFTLQGFYQRSVVKLARSGRFQESTEETKESQKINGCSGHPINRNLIS